MNEEWYTAGVSEMAGRSGVGIWRQQGTAGESHAPTNARRSLPLHHPHPAMRYRILLVCRSR